MNSYSYFGGKQWTLSLQEQNPTSEGSPKIYDLGIWQFKTLRELVADDKVRFQGVAAAYIRSYGINYQTKSAAEFNKTYIYGNEFYTRRWFPKKFPWFPWFRRENFNPLETTGDGYYRKSMCWGAVVNLKPLEELQCFKMYLWRLSYRRFFLRIPLGGQKFQSDPFPIYEFSHTSEPVGHPWPDVPYIEFANRKQVSDILEGTELVINENVFKVVSKLGVGEFLAENSVGSKIAVVYKIRPMKQLRNEAAVLYRLGRLFALRKDEKFPLLAMTYYEGDPWANEIQRVDEEMRNRDGEFQKFIQEVLRKEPDWQQQYFSFRFEARVRNTFDKIIQPRLKESLKKRFQEEFEQVKIALQKLHKDGVIHGAVDLKNIIKDKNGQFHWINFESSQLTDGLTQRRIDQLKEKDLDRLKIDYGKIGEVNLYKVLNSYNES